MKKYVWLVMMSACVRCPDAPKTEVGDASVDASVDAGADASNGETVDGAKRLTACDHACANLEKFHCPESLTPTNGDTCTVVCQRAEATGKLSLKPACVADAGTVEAIRACGTVRCQK
jgi:hypothetical protein